MSTQARQWTPQELAAQGERLLGQPPQETLAWAVEHFFPRLALACSFGAEDVALVDMLWRLEPRVTVFYLDTGLLFPETLEVKARVEEKYGITPVRVAPQLSVAEQDARYGAELWRHNPDQCCQLRKVEPLAAYLASGLGAWITGIRRQQAPTRAHALPVEWDAKFGLVKINPLVLWSHDEVWRYIREHGVPYNPLHDRGYPSIGCAPCTRPVAPGEDPRAGRWAGFNKTECGLHK